MPSKSSNTAEIIHRARAIELLPKRQPGTHKWEVGAVLIVGGAPGYVGAPALCSAAAGRAGAGIVLAAVSRSVVPTVSMVAPETVFLPLPEGDHSSAARQAVDKIRELEGKLRAIVIGPGLSTDRHAFALLEQMMGSSDLHPARVVGFGVDSGTNNTSHAEPIVGASVPAVVDADALNWLSEQESWWDRVQTQTMLLTPHSGEMARMTGLEPEKINGDPIGVATEAAKKWKQLVLLKGYPSIATDGESAFSAGDAPTSLASAGTGDVLSGMIGAFLAQGLTPMEAAQLGLFVGAEAARVVEKETGTLGLVAGDLPRAIATVLANLEREAAGA